MELPEEQNKLKEIAAGNVEAFEHLFFQYQPRLVNFLIGLTHDKEVSRDMAQDLFLSLWKDREKLKNVRSFSSYLFQMARFTVYDYFDRLIVSEKYTNEYLQEPNQRKKPCSSASCNRSSTVRSSACLPSEAKYTG